jgi:hypothetical protein
VSMAHAVLCAEMEFHLVHKNATMITLSTVTAAPLSANCKPVTNLAYAMVIIFPKSTDPVLLPVVTKSKPVHNSAMMAILKAMTAVTLCV